MSGLGTYTFLPWARQGSAAAVTTVDDFGVSQPGRALLDVTLTVNGAPIAVPVQLNGPGDVLGFDRRQVVRTEPRAGTFDFEPNYFPAIEFDRPDFPWMFTPLAANAAGRLRPWICLVVVRKQPGVAIRVRPMSGVSVLEISSPAVPARELPNLADSWAWGHVQAAGSLQAGPPLTELETKHPERTVSRLLCPRKLAEQTSYIACVVPAFELGVKAGLTQPITAADEAALRPAWESGPLAPATVQLPVYYHWEFTTTTAGDFESLARLLKGRSVPATVGYREMYVGDAGHGLPSMGREDPGAVLAMEGALRAPGNPPKPWPNPPRAVFEAKLREILDTPETQLAQSGGDPIVAPPIYGRWHAAQTVVPVAAPAWLRELNLDPRHRAAAGLGTQVVQDQQEQLMESAWAQVGEVLRANRALREAQLARAAGVEIVAKHLQPMSDAQVVATTAAAHSRLRLGGTTLRHQIAESALPASAVRPIFRRLVRPGGPVRRRFPVPPPAGRPPAPLLERLNSGEIAPMPERTLPKGAVTPDWVSGRLWGREPPAGPYPRSGVLTAELVKSATPPPGLQLPVYDPDRDMYVLRDASPEEIANFRDAAIRHLDATNRLRDLPGPPKPPPLDLPAIREGVMGAIDPRVTIPARVRARIDFGGPVHEWDDPIEPIMAHPVFPQPMYESLRDLSQDHLVPGVDEVPPNSVTLLETNPRFIEAFMIGLNHEMSRELLWREYPTDQRGSYFRQFWDVRGRIPEPQTEAEIEDAKDIVPIHTWKKSLGIGGNTGGPGVASKLVLLIRGELLRRYPNTVIYAVEAVASANPFQRDLGTVEEYPLFRGSLSPDITFIGFDLTAEQALTGGSAGKGWFFVLQEQPTEPRFGLDVAEEPFGAQPASWDDLSWAHLAADQAAFDQLTHAPATGAYPKPPPSPGAAQWGQNAAHLAHITLQHPMRVAIHASAMIESGGTQP